MPQEKLTCEEIDGAIEDKKKLLVNEMKKAWEVLGWILEREFIEQTNKISWDILNLFKQKKQLEIDQNAQEEDQEFLKIEQEVLAWLPEDERTRITTMRKVLRDGDGDYFETSYKQVIMKIHLWEVSITKDSVVFHYAGKELEKKELQLNTMRDRDIFVYNYTDFDGKDRLRKVVRQKVFNRDNINYNYIQKVQKKLEQEGKYIATVENGIWAILDGFKWLEAQKIKAMQFLTGFIGHWILSLEKDNKDCRTMLISLNHKDSTNIYDDDDPRAYGSLFVAKDC